MLKTKLFLSLFLISYIFVGLYDQNKFIADIYPYSDWYLFSFVDTESVIRDVKYGENYLLNSLDKYEKTKVAENLQRLSKTINSEDFKNAHQIIKKICDDFNIRGEVLFVEKRVELLDYYRERKVLGEEIVFKWNF